jgi:hypothetical protein
MYIGIYFAFGIGSAALVVVQTLILWIFCSIEVSLPLRVLIDISVYFDIPRLQGNYMREWRSQSFGHR